MKQNKTLSREEKNFVNWMADLYLKEGRALGEIKLKVSAPIHPAVWNLVDQGFVDAINKLDGSLLLTLTEEAMLHITEEVCKRDPNLFNFNKPIDFKKAKSNVLKRLTDEALSLTKKKSE